MFPADTSLGIIPARPYKNGGLFTHLPPFDDTPLNSSSSHDGNLETTDEREPLPLSTENIFPNIPADDFRAPYVLRQIPGAKNDDVTRIIENKEIQLKLRNCKLCVAGVTLLCFIAIVIGLLFAIHFNVEVDSYSLLNNTLDIMRDVGLSFSGPVEYPLTADDLQILEDYVRRHNIT